MNIKICGINSMKQLRQLDGLDVDFAGLIFHKPSPRYAGDKIAENEIKDADLDIKTVGVFVDESYESIINIVEAYELDAVQLHGNETPYLCEQLSEDVEVIKAFGVGATTGKTIDQIVADYDDVCDYYLFDTSLDNRSGGTGKKFDWKYISEAKIEKPFFLSGGIAPDDVQLLKKFKHPDFFGVDINSRFEKEPGVKDMALVLQFVNALRK